jgi:hypothetical protein
MTVLYRQRYFSVGNEPYNCGRCLEYLCPLPQPGTFKRRFPVSNSEEEMQRSIAYTCFPLLIASFCLSQQISTQKDDIPGPPETKPSPVQADPKLKAMFESKIKTEWEALKKKDAKAYGELLADDYEGVEVDGKGERTRTEALLEVPGGNIADYTLWGFKLIPLGPDAAYLIYEVNIQFPPRSAVRYSRVYITELWVRKKGEWKELHYQETHVK